jgi:hypothetical protein
MESKIARLYQEVDVAPPSHMYPIAPLGPVLERMQIRFDEIPNLTLREAESFLRQRKVLHAPLEHGSDNPNARISGFIYSDGYIARLLVNSSESITRRRFSIAHELGHFILHCRPIAEAIANGEPFIDMLDLDVEGHELREKEADEFAATLLMPKAIILSLANQAISQGKYEEQVIKEVAEYMLVSRRAAQRRLAQLRWTK